MLLQRMKSRRHIWLAALMACPAFAVQTADAPEQWDRETLRTILREGSPSEQMRAFDTLQSFDSKFAVESVVADFHDHQLGSRLQSLQVIDLSPTIDPATVTSLLREALHDQDTAVSDYAILALSRRLQADTQVFSASDLAGPDTQVQQLARLRLAAVSHDDDTLRELIRKGDGAVLSAAFEALVADDTAGAFSELVAGFEDQSSPNRLEILKLLVRTLNTDPQLLKQVMQHATSDEDPVVRDYAVAFSTNNS
jgi:hypothetical protein